VFAAPAWAVPVASFTYAPTAPLTSETVTFTSTSTGATTLDWDLDGDGMCDDGSGPVVTSAFPVAGIYDVKLCAGDGVLNTTQEQQVLVANRPPVASFGFVPAAPVAKELVTFTSTAVDPDGPIVAQAWDLDGDGVFDDAIGETAKYFWVRAGTYPVALRVTDRDGASAVANMSVVVAPRPPGVFNPAPLVRVVGVPTATGAHLNLLAVSAPKGAHVGVRCKGGNCPYKHKRFTSKGKRVILRKLSRTYAAGTVIEVRVTKSETIGKFTRLRIRAGQNPARLDRCLQSGKPNKPMKDCSS
jgi:PKD repeat protein